MKACITMDRMFVLLLILSAFAFCRGGQETGFDDAEQPADMGQEKMWALRGISPNKLTGLRSDRNTVEVGEDFPKENNQPLPLSNIQSRSSKESKESTSAIFPRDCDDILVSGETTSGVYTVYVGRLKRSVSVFCDMSTDEGGWTVFQRRKDGSVKFERKWDEYAAGFGNVAGEFWLGNNNIHLITKKRKYELRIDFRDWNNASRYAVYNDFSVASACDGYRLISLGKYICGNAGDSLTYHVGQKFSTLDQDNDRYGRSCAVVFRGAWWYNSCHNSNLNGFYYRGAHTSYGDGVNWETWTGDYYSLNFIEMKIRPVDI